MINILLIAGLAILAVGLLVLIAVWIMIGITYMAIKLEDRKKK